MNYVRLKTQVSQVTGADVSQEAPYARLEDVDGATGSLVSLGDLPRITGAAPGIATVAAGDVLFGKLRPYLQKTFAAPGLLHVSTELIAMRAGGGIDPRWLSWLVRSRPFVEWAVATSEGTKMPRTSWDRLAEFRFPLPSLADQARVSTLLQAETLRIDALIAKKRESRELLLERRFVEEERRVLGLDLAGEKGRDWYRHRPHGWQVTALRHLSVQVQTGPFGSQLQADEYVEGGIPVLNPSNLVDGHIIETAGIAIDVVKHGEMSRHEVAPGDVLLGRRGEMGRTAVVTLREAGWLCGTGLLRLRPDAGVLHPHYLAAVLRTRALKEYFSLHSVGSTMDNLGSEQALAAPIVVPPMAEQLAIAAAVEKAGRRASALIRSIGQQIELLKEHREARITAAVTGQMTGRQ